MVDVGVVGGVLLLDAEPSWTGDINTILVMKGVKVSELRYGRRPQQTSYRSAATVLA
jgi:hypothetical protein